MFGIETVSELGLGAVAGRGIGIQIQPDSEMANRQRPGKYWLVTLKSQFIFSPDRTPATRCETVFHPRTFLMVGY